jgi:hypothetical protein
MKKLLVSLLLLVFGSGAFAAADDFNRADGAVGSNWTTTPSSDPLQIVSNQVVGGASSSTGEGGIWNAHTFGNDHYSKVFNVNGFEISDDRALVDLRLRDDGAGNFYAVRVDRVGATTDFTLQIYKFVSSTPTLLASDTSSVPIDDGHDWEGRVVGDLITLLMDGVVVLSHNDSTFASGAASPLGFSVYTFDAMILSIDSWEGGNVGGSSPVLKIMQMSATEPANDPDYFQKVPAMLARRYP